MASQDNGNNGRNHERQGSSRIQRLTLLASLLAVCAPFALGAWIYIFSEQPLSEAQHNLTRLSARLKAIDLLFKMRPQITVHILKVYPHEKHPNNYYVDYEVENKGGYSAYYMLNKACIVEATTGHISKNNLCAKKNHKSRAFDSDGPFIIAPGDKTHKIMTLDHKHKLRIGERIFIEIATYADQKLSAMALKIANEDFELGIKSNYFRGFYYSNLKITSEANCGENTWCPE
jgi:hypothetical protein